MLNVGAHDKNNVSFKRYYVAQNRAPTQPEQLNSLRTYNKRLPSNIMFG